jgi:hypothetical protein
VEVEVAFVEKRLTYNVLNLSRHTFSCDHCAPFFSFRLPDKAFLQTDIRNSNGGHWKKVLDRFSLF